MKVLFWLFVIVVVVQTLFPTVTAMLSAQDLIIARSKASFRNAAFTLKEAMKHTEPEKRRMTFGSHVYELDYNRDLQPGEYFPIIIGGINTSTHKRFHIHVFEKPIGDPTRGEWMLSALRYAGYVVEEYGDCGYNLQFAIGNPRDED